MATSSPATLLDTLDAGLARHPVDRALALLALGSDGEGAADLPLGERNWRLMGLRRARFGEHVSVWVDCTACGARMAFEFDARDLPPAPAERVAVEVDGHSFRQPTSRDLAALAAAPDPRAGARALFRACALEPDALPEAEALDALMSRAEAALDAADPWTDPTLLAACPECGHAEEVALDVPGIVWDEFSTLAGRLLDEAHALASAYGWAERDILAMSPARRSAYLARVEA